MVGTPVRVAAEARGLRVFTPEYLPGFADDLRALGADAFVVASYGRIVPQALLDIVPIAFNVHPSLLPLYRGATPLQTVLRDGRGESGVSIIAMDAGMDTGDVLVQETLAVGERETYGELHDRTALIGARLVIAAIDAYASGRLERRVQSTMGVAESDIAATATRPIRKDDTIVTLGSSPRAVVDTIRSLAPAPAARAAVEGEMVKVLDARVAASDEADGTVTADGGAVRAGVVLLRVVPPNRSAMTGAAWQQSVAAVRA